MRCQVCGKNTIKNEYDYCPVCNWCNIMDHIENPDDYDANGLLTLNEARKQWKEQGKLTKKWNR